MAGSGQILTGAALAMERETRAFRANVTDFSARTSAGDFGFIDQLIHPHQNGTVHGENLSAILIEAF